MEKTCRDCGTTKPIDEFHRDAKRANGHAIRCKPCMRKKLAEYQMRPQRHQSPDGMKRCTLCKETKPVSEYARNKNFHDGLNRFCKACNNARSSAYAKANRGALNEKQKQRYQNNPERYADYDLKRHFGLPPGSYDRMFEEQGGRCAICQATEPGGRTRRFHLDHCHTTGRIRALLCENCNNGLGRFHDDPMLLRAAAYYLEVYSQ